MIGETNNVERPTGSVGQPTSSVQQPTSSVQQSTSSVQQPTNSVERPTYEYVTFPRKFISYKWYKPLFVLVLGFVFMVVIELVLMIVAIACNGGIDFVTDIGMTYDDMNAYTGPGALFELGSIAGMLPALALAALIVRDRPYSSYSSSRGGWNWGAFAKCLVVAAIVMGVSTIIDLLIPGHMEANPVNKFTVVGFILCTVLVPFQCVAEEYVFRGLIMQTVGSWFKLPVVGIIVSAVVFAIGHLYNSIGLVLIFCNGIVWGIIAWQTKGLEATSAVHIVNNYLAFYLCGFGLQLQTSEVDLASLPVAIVIDVVYAAAVILLGRKYNWFTSKGDGAAAFNEKKRAQIAAKQQKRLAKQGVPPDPPLNARAEQLCKWSLRWKRCRGG